MKKSFKLVSSLCVGLLAIGAGVALSNVGKVEAKEAEAFSSIVPTNAKYAYLETGSIDWPSDNAQIKCGYGEHSQNVVDAELVNVYWSGTDTFSVYRVTLNNDVTDIEWLRKDPNSSHIWNSAKAYLYQTNHFKLNGWDSCEDAGVIVYFDKGEMNGGDVTLTYDGVDLFGKQFESKMGSEGQKEVVLEAEADEGYSFTSINLNGYSKFNIERVGFHSGWQIANHFGWYGSVTGTFKSSAAYSVEFDANGGEGEMDPVTADPESVFEIPASKFTCDGYKQVGWATQQEGEVVYTTSIPANTYSDGDEVTLYAVWEEVGEKTYYFTNNKSWDEVYCHYWGSSLGETTMPGVECEFAYINENDENVYSVVVPDDISGLLFNNKNNGQQTKNIEGELLNKQAFYCVGDSSPYDVGEWEVKFVTVSYNLEGGTGTVPADHSVYYHAKGMLVDDGSEFTKGDLVFKYWVNNLAEPEGCVKSYIGTDGKTYIDTTSDSVPAGGRIELHAVYGEAPAADGYYIIGDMTYWDIDPTLMMNYDDQEDQYSLAVTLEVDDEFKVAKVEGGVAKDYYGYEVLESGEGSAKDASQIVEAENTNMKVAYAGTYTPYFKLSSSTIWISAIEETHLYQIKVNDTTYDLVANPGNPDEYMTASDVSLTSGDILAYYKDEELQTADPKAIGNNNCYSNEGVTTVCLNIESKIYVDIKANTIFCDGLVANKFYMSVNNNPVDLKHNESPVDPSFIEYYTTGYTFAYNDVIKFVDTNELHTNAKVFDVLTVSKSSTEGFEVVDNKLLCTASEGKQTNVYVKLKSGADEVYFGDVAEDVAAAIKFAQEFNTALESVCVAQGQTVVADLQAAWQAQATSFGSLMEAAQTILKDATTEDSNLDIKAFAAKYDYVYSHYTSELEDYGGNFVDRTPVAASPFLFGLANDNSTLITIVVICSVSSITLLGAILLIKRRRNAVK